MFEVLLMLKPVFAGESVFIARTDDPGAVRAAQAAIRAKALGDVAEYECDPALKAVAMAELRRIEAVFKLGGDGKCSQLMKLHKS